MKKIKILWEDFFIVEFFLQYSGCDKVIHSAVVEEKD